MTKPPRSADRPEPAAAPPRLSLADALFTTTQQRVLGLLFGQPDRSFYGNELIALVQGGSGAVQRELARLVQSELVTVRASGNQKHYQANAASPIFLELCAIAQKTVGLADPILAALIPFRERIGAAFIYGSIARRQDTAASDVDVMVVSDEVGYADLFEALESAGRQLGRAINPTVYSSQEFTEKLRRGNAFLKRVMAQPRIWLVGSADAIGL